MDDNLQWFTLQVHATYEGQTPPDLNQAQVVIDKVKLVYLAPGLANQPPETALDPASRMLFPAWKFSGHITNTGGVDLTYKAFVQAVANS